MIKAIKNRRTERGGAGVKVLIILVILFLIGNAGINFIPVVYEGASFKQDMEAAVLQGAAIPNKRLKPADFVKGKIQNAASNNNIPADAFVEIKSASGVVQARVAYTKQIEILPFGIYSYIYEFDHTATPAGFLTKEIN